MNKTAVVKTALETYIISNTDLSPNYRRDALVLSYDLSGNTLEEVLDNSNSYFLGIIYDAISRLIADSPNDSYSGILREIEQRDD
jgi:hypothetical protein